MEELMRRFNPWWEEQYEFPGIPRTHYLSILGAMRDQKDVVFITGLRRVGKTTLLHQFIHTLLKDIDPGRILYLSLDNIAFRDHTIQDLLDIFRRIRSLKHTDQIFVFLDEIHFKADFELELKNIYDLGHVKVFASGSASLDIIMRTPYLTGRQRVIRISPLSFREFLQFTGRTISLADQQLFEAAALEFATVGGLPEYVLRRDPNVLQSLLDTVLYRDIADRHNIRKRESVRDVLLHIAQSVSTPISASRIGRVLELKPDTVRHIIGLLAEANLIHPIERVGGFAVRKVSPRKFYLGDNGLFTILTENINLGAKVENVVFLALANRETVRFWREGRAEVDFIFGKQAIESKYRSKLTSDDTMHLQTVEGFSPKTIVTANITDIQSGMKLIPLWRFLWEQDH